jgi:Ca2+-transporting ATPase
MVDKNSAKELMSELCWHTLDAGEVMRRLRTDIAYGLDSAGVAVRAREFGSNQLIDEGPKNPWRILWDQLTAVMVLILLAAAVVSGSVGDFEDAVVILAIVVLFTALGFIQEYRAERALAGLKRLEVPLVRVRRDGEVKVVSACELVPGDIVLIEAGNKIPADCRLVESANLRVEEAALTGESEPVEKETKILDSDSLPLGDRRNMVYAGTAVTYGRGAGVVVTTGMRTELGRIASLIQRVKRECTPLEQRLNHLGKTLGLAAIAIAIIIFGLGLLRGEPLGLMLMMAVSVAVAAVPEGLPAVVTITLAIGAQRMLKRHALIRKLPAVETLGSVTVICSDKTGTLTENRMTVTVLDVAGHRLELSDQPHQHTLMLASEMDHLDGELMPATSLDPSLILLLTGSALCNDAILKANGQPRSFETVGDPTEGALRAAAARVGLWKQKLDAVFPRVAELPFDSERKRMTTVHKFASSPESLPESLRKAWQLGLSANGGQTLAFVKGSVDGLLALSRYVLENGCVTPLTAELHARVTASSEKLAVKGMRVLGVAVRPMDHVAYELATIENELCFVGVVGMIDPPRPEVREAVRKCQSAGIRPVMITGDHPLTASYIARDLGLIANGGRTVTGRELDRWTDSQLQSAVEEVSVFARVSPEHKFRIVEALQARGHIVAMTGDGVNDAPALKRANIGVAMGISGTEVSKEAADMVLRDDNFATIVASVEEGRTIYDNIRKFIKYSIGGNVGKILIVLVAPVAGMPMALLPLQLLWLNLLTDGLLGLGLGVEKPELDVMRRQPQTPGESIFARGMGRHIIWLGLLIAAVTLGIGYWYWSAKAENWQTVTFTTIAFLQVGQAFAVRSSRDSLFQIGVTSNRLLLTMAIAAVSLQLAVVYIAPLRQVFGTHALSHADLAICAAAGSLAFAAIEFEKWLGRHGERLKHLVPGPRDEGDRNVTQTNKTLGRLRRIY